MVASRQVRSAFFRKSSQRLLGGLALLLLFLPDAQAQAEMRYADLPNFHQVNARLYRGAQPKRGGLLHLARLGVKTIINLRGTDERTRAEEEAAHALGLNFYNVPLPNFHRPADAAVKQLLMLINDPALQPVFVHCKRGADRTGTIIACYRLQHDHWPPQAALAEAKHYGMSWLQRGMKNYVKDFARHDGVSAGLPAKTVSRAAAWRRPVLLLCLKGASTHYVPPCITRPV